MNYTFYDLSTGLFTNGQSYSGPDAPDSSNTPKGMGAVLGLFDHLSQKFDLTTGEVVDYQPPAPADDEMQTWAWSTDTKRWVSSPTVAAFAAAARADRDARLAASDWVDRAAQARVEALARWLRQHP